MKTKNSSLVKKLIVYFLLLNIITVIVVGSYSYYRAKDALVKRTFDQLTSLRIEKKSRIQRFFKDRISDIQRVSKLEEIKNILSLSQNKKLNHNSKNNLIFLKYNEFLRTHSFSGDDYQRFFIINSDSLAVCFSPLPSDSSQLNFSSVSQLPVYALWQKILTEKQTLIEDYNPHTNNSLPALFIGTPIKDSELSGVLIVEISIDALNAIMYENNPQNGLGKSGESYLVGSDFLMRSTSRFQNNSVFKTTVKTPGVEDALLGKTGKLRFKDYRNVSVLSSYSPVDIPGLNWAILSEIDVGEAMIPVQSIRNNILYLGVLISLFLFAIVYLIATRISSPIIRLKHAAQTITDGNYDVIVETNESNDEIASLIHAFNEMSAKIKDQTEHLKLERTMRINSMIDGQELERQRLSRELHDGLGQSILAIKMRLERTANASPEKQKQIMQEVQVLFANTINEIRNISNDLMPAVLNEFGLVDALTNLCRDISKSSGIEIDFIHSSFSATINDRISTYLYRISQEALSNILKHAQANYVLLELESDAESASFIVSDNGNGFSYVEGEKLCGNGISNIKERVHLLNGTIEILSQKGKGTSIKIQIPLKN